MSLILRWLINIFILTCDRSEVEFKNSFVCLFIYFKKKHILFRKQRKNNMFDLNI